LYFHSFFTCVSTCVSKRRKEIIAEEINILGMVKKSEVEEKRKEFLKYLRALEDRGEISLKPDKDIYVS
jgi:flagellar motor switch protein FliG